MNQRVLDQRYELEEFIGGGGMADVYKAKDLLLGRPVAVKILHDQFKSDTEFINKFHREAQAAARLSHPNIVNIYDVGVNENLHYIVMEYVPGSTLKDKIRQEGHLSVPESLRIAKDIAGALAHAHANNIVHCDIKPHNILMMPDGSAKVADFGIARAVTESTMTYSGNVVGSVHYFSPEQAKGTMITPKSDVYSLGVVLYEMLTGKLPFTGETPVSIAVKHLQEEPVPVGKIDPAIPAVVEAIVSRAMSKDPDLRPNSQDLVTELAKAEQLLNLNGYGAAAGVDPYATQVMPRVQASEQAHPLRRSQPVRKPDDYDDDKESSIFKSKKFIAGLIIVLLMGFFVGAFMSFGKFWSTAEVVVPDVKGQSMIMAKQTLEEKNLRVRVQEEFSADVEPGKVFKQDPEAGSKVKEERTVTIYVSKGGESLEMPDLKGLSKADAVAKLEKMGLKVGSIYEKNSDDEPGTVIATDPRAGSRISKGHSVDITVSKGQKNKNVSVPDVAGMNVESARNTLSAAGFKVSISMQASRQAKNTVISQSPSGEAPAGATISLVIADGNGSVEADKNKHDNKAANKEPAKVPTVNDNSKGR